MVPKHFFVIFLFFFSAWAKGEAPKKDLAGFRGPETGQKGPKKALFGPFLAIFGLFQALRILLSLFWGLPLGPGAKKKTTKHKKVFWHRFRAFGTTLGRIFFLKKMIFLLCPKSAMSLGGT